MNASQRGLNGDVPCRNAGGQSGGVDCRQRRIGGRPCNRTADVRVAAVRISSGGGELLGRIDKNRLRSRRDSNRNQCGTRGKIGVRVDAARIGGDHRRAGRHAGSQTSTVHGHD